MGALKSRTAKFFMLLIIVAVVMLAFGPAVFAEDLLEKSARINKACLRCHAAVGINAEFDGKKKDMHVDPVAYEKSMHGTMPCIYCHTNIEDYPHTKALKGKALVEQVNSECRRCHKDITPAYNKSVHGQVHNGKRNAYCSNCHGIHNIYKKEVKGATINKNTVPFTCGECHDKILPEYEADFHGKLVILGGRAAASCVDCHGAHNVLGPKEAESMVSEENIPKTCAKCHLFEYKNYGNGKMHYPITPKGEFTSKVSFWTLEFFTWLTIGTITFVMVLILMELRRKWQDADRPDDH